MRKVILYIAMSLDGFISKPKDDLIDEYIISVIPIIVGAGVRLFGDENPELLLELVSSRKFEKGLVQLHYRRKKR